ncbi:MAG: DNA translocase FtsK 4TM domain-containing protein, partial [Kofleriaceae bacterium]|nr:DNA translocase FtsK 4TM domain-containing protein [Kofleriaceae bacterium]
MSEKILATIRTAKNARSTRASGNRKRKPVKKKVAKSTKAGKAGKSSKDKSKVKRRGIPGSERGTEMLGVLALGTSIFLVAGLISLQFGDGLLMGPFGRTLAAFVYSLFGIGSHVLAVCGAVVAVRMLMEKRTVAKTGHVIGIFLGLLSLSVLLQLAASSYIVAGYGPGGRLGASFATLFQGLVSTAGTALVASITLLLS